MRSLSAVQPLKPPTMTVPTLLDAGALPNDPPKANLVRDIHQPLPANTAALDWRSISDVGAIARPVVHALASALGRGDADALAECFLRDGPTEPRPPPPPQALPRETHWRDSLALTAHLRTFSGRARIVPALLELAGARGFAGIEFGGAEVRDGGETVGLRLS
jgi:hypothetical protein